MAATLVVPPHLQRDRSTYKLTQLAKRVAIPRGVVGTDWGPVRDTCRNDLGIEFDAWQDGAGQILLARETQAPLDDGGILAHTVGGFHLSAMRQVGKTFLGAGALFGMSQHYPGLLTIWTAHHTATSDETFDAMQGFADRVRVRPHIEYIHTGSGDEEIKFWNGSRILFGARERGFGRGIPGVDVFVFDEGQIMSERAAQNTIATLNTSWLGLHIYFGTPPKPEDNSESWMRARDEAWEIEDPRIVQTETTDLAWIEFGADDDANPDDIEQWAKNPSAFHRTPIQAFQRLRKKLNDDGYMREGLGVYDKKSKSIFDMTKWNRLAAPDADQPNRAALVLDVSPDRKWSAIGIAGELSGVAESDDEIERSLVMVKSLPGTGGAAAAINELNTLRDLVVIKITPNAARSVETRLTKLGIEYDIMPQSEVNAAYGDLQEAIKAGTVAHLEQPELNLAMLNVKTRFLQTGEAESFDRREQAVDGIDTSPAVAAACALYQWGLNSDPLPFIG